MKLLIEETKVHFNGSALGIYILSGPDAGIVEVSIDGGMLKAPNLHHRYSKGLHYPRTVMLASGSAMMITRLAFV